MIRRGLLLLGLPGLVGIAGLALPAHSYLAALGPGLEAADENGDGRLTASEAARSSPAPLPFERYDADGDGAWSEAELLSHTLATDPALLGGAGDQQDPSPHDHLLYSADPKPVRVLRVLFEFMAAEVLTVDKRTPLPSDAQILAAARTGRLDSPEAQAVAANLVAAYQACGLQVPAMLAEVEPKLAAGGPRQPPQLDRPQRGPGPRGDRAERPERGERPPRGERPEQPPRRRAR